MRAASATAPERPKVTASFLTKVGGVFTNDWQLYVILRPPVGPSAKTVFVEDVYRRMALDLERSEAVKMRVVRPSPNGFEDNGLA